MAENPGAGAQFETSSESKCCDSSVCQSWLGDVQDQTDESNDEPLEAGSLPVLKQMMQEKYFQKYRAEHKRITKLYQLMEWFHEFYSKQLHLDQMGVVGFRMM